MAVYYIDFQNGSDANSGTLGEGSPRKTFPSGADGDVYRLKRGSVYAGTAQIGFGTRQGIVITDYGNPAAPKPAVEAIHTASSSSINHTGDAIWHNVELRNIQRSASETTASNTGQNAIYFGVRGNGTFGAVEGVSGVVIGCDFKQIGNNAITFNGIANSAQYAMASPVGIVLGCSFDGLGGDGIFGAVRDYLEVGYCSFANLGNRIEPLVTDAPVGARQSASDAIGLINACPSLSWIHDNLIDHSTWDCKHSIMLDCSAAQAGNLAVVERNIILGYGAGSTFAQSINNVGVNSKVRLLMRQNLVKGSRILLNMHDQVASAEIYSNIFHVLGVDGANAAIAIFSDNTTFRGNSVIGQGHIAGTAVAKTSGADRFAAYQNLVQGFNVGFSLGNPAQAAYQRNGFFDVGAAYMDGATPLSADSSDVVSAATAVQPGTFTHSDARLMFKQVDRRVPDFWGRFAADGIAHVGATLGVF